MAGFPDFAARLAAHPRRVSLALGVLAACGFEPLRLWPLTLLALAGFIALIARAPSARQAAVLGWLFGLGHFALGNNWIATAFTYQANMPAWLGWIAVVALSGYLAVYPALAALGAWLARRNALALVLAFAGCWIVSEWLRSWVFTGYAWNPLAMAALGPFERPGLAAIAPFTGTYGLSGIVIGLAGCWLIAARRRDAASLVLAVLPIACLTLVPTPAVEGARSLPYTLVQPDVRQEDLNDPDHFATQFARTAQLSRPADPAKTRLVLWPESGMPYYLEEGYPAYYYAVSTYEADPALVRAGIGRAIGPASMVLTGTVDLEMRGGRPVAARNSITAIDGAGAIRGSYDKAHLVPYGEYLPLRWLLEPLGASRLVAGSLDFWPGPGPRTLDLGPWGKAGMQICYEIVFSGQVVDRADRPGFIFNPSNDGWFGSWGPPQHLAQARLRAIEEGLPVLRATTTGISAVVAANGVVEAHVPRHVAARLDGLIPPARAPTPFALLGNMLPLALAAILLGLSLVALRRGRGYLAN